MGAPPPYLWSNFDFCNVKLLKIPGSHHEVNLYKLPIYNNYKLAQYHNCNPYNLEIRTKEKN